MHARVRKWEQVFGRFQDTQLTSQSQFDRSLQINEEWHAIEVAPGFSGFLRWLSHPDRLGFRFLQMPTADGLDVIRKCLQKECDKVATQIKKDRSRLFKIKVNIDVLAGSGSFTFKLLRPTPNRPLDALHINQRVELTRMRMWTKNQLQYHVSENLDVALPVWVENFHYYFEKTHDGSVKLVPPTKLNSLHEQHHRTLHQKSRLSGVQKQWITNPETIAQHVCQYWNQFWLRDKSQYLEHDFVMDQPLDEFPAFQDAVDILDRFLPVWDEFVVNIPVDAWHRALRALPTHAAKGCDGFSKDDLLLLPDSTWELLANMLNACHNWPQVLLCCKTFLLPKCNEPSGPDQTRPITVAAIVYRLWASLHAKVILLKWSHSMPPTIAGGLPGKGTADLLMHLYHDLEMAYAENHVVSGCVLDLIKAFNCIARPLALFALKKLGTPQWIVQKWSRALVQLQRFVSIAGSVADGIESCTGLPEGDCFSILGMISIAYAWSNLIAHDQLKVYCYADNFEWLARDFDLHMTTLQKTDNFLRCMRMSLSQDKTFCWATDKQDEKKWSTLWKQIFPSHQAKLVQDATDLGCEVHYGSKCRHTILPARFDKAIQKCAKLQMLPLEVSVKVALVIRSILPTALHGTEFAIPSDKLFHKLRSAIGKSVIGNFKTASPWIACNVLVIDPEYHFIRNCLRKCVKYFQKNIDKQQSFWTLVQFADSASTFFRGPAGVLAYVCRRLGWLVRQEGSILAAPGLTFTLATVDVRQVFQQMDVDWVKVVNSEISHRVFLDTLPSWNM